MSTATRDCGIFNENTIQQIYSSMHCSPITNIPAVDDTRAWMKLDCFKGCLATVIAARLTSLKKLGIDNAVKVLHLYRILEESSWHEQNQNFEANLGVYADRNIMNKAMSRPHNPDFPLEFIQKNCESTLDVLDSKGGVVTLRKISEPDDLFHDILNLPSVESIVSIPANHHSKIQSDNFSEIINSTNAISPLFQNLNVLEISNSLSKYYSLCGSIGLCMFEPNLRKHDPDTIRTFQFQLLLKLKENKKFHPEIKKLYEYIRTLSQELNTGCGALKIIHEQLSSYEPNHPHETYKTKIFIATIENHLLIHFVIYVDCRMSYISHKFLQNNFHKWKQFIENKGGKAYFDSSSNARSQKVRK